MSKIGGDSHGMFLEQKEEARFERDRRVRRRRGAFCGLFGQHGEGEGELGRGRHSRRAGGEPEAALGGAQHAGGACGAHGGACRRRHLEQDGRARLVQHAGGDGGRRFGRHLQERRLHCDEQPCDPRREGDHGLLAGWTQLQGDAGGSGRAHGHRRGEGRCDGSADGEVRQLG